ncbi:MAG: hypothetical protein KDD47_09165 [Acidobacteria bacterium]|nr:hypothetical protein [Acidobacteriota bacterium]
MSKLAALSPLRDLLVDLYPTKESSYRVVDEAGLRRGPIAFDNAAADNWQAILVEAHRQGKVRALVAVVQGQYEEQAAALAAALETYETAEETAEDRPPPRKKPWWLYTLLAVLAVALGILLFLRFRPGPEPSPDILCLFPNSGLIMQFMEPGRYSVELRPGPEGPPLARVPAAEGILCLLAVDEGAEAEAEEAVRAFLPEGLGAECVEKDNGEDQGTMSEFWAEGLSFRRLSGKAIPEEVYLKVDDNEGALMIEGSSRQLRTTASRRIRILCLPHDLASPT